VSSPTIDNVAKEAGVSIKTVSRVINGEPNVSEKTRLKVEAAIDQLGYQPNLSARQLASKRSFLIALLYDSFLAASSYVVRVQYGVIQHCHKEGYELLIHPVTTPENERAENIKAFIKRTRVDGVILTPPLSDDANIADLLDDFNVPYVRLSPVAERQHGGCVRTDDRHAIHQLTEQFIRKGHHSIAFIAGRPDHMAVTERRYGFEAAIKAHRITLPETFIQQGASTFDSGYEATQNLLNQPSRPTAIVCANDEMAAGAISAVLDAKLTIPNDICITGFDDGDLATQCWPSLTTIRQPMEAMGDAAARLLLQSLRNDAVSEDISLNTELIVRRSTGRL
jgi:LacI family transcriptional regulator